MLCKECCSPERLILCDTISDRFHNGMKIIPDWLSVYIITNLRLDVHYILDRFS